MAKGNGSEFTEEELAADTQELRNTAASGYWPDKLLEKYHPRDGFSAKEMDMPAPLQMSLVLLQEASVSGFISLIGYPMQAQPSELFRWAIQDTGYIDSDVTLGQEFEKYSELFGVLNKSYKDVMDLKEQLKVKRPSTYSPESQQLFGDTYARPSSRAWLLAQTVISLNALFDLTDEQLTQLQDSAYIMAMLNVLAGHNHVEDVLYAFREKGMWDLKARKHVSEQVGQSAADAAHESGKILH